jgi:chromosome segregation ATPase
MTEIIEANAQLRRQVEDFAAASDEKNKLQEQYQTIWTELLAERESRTEIQRRNQQLETELSRFREENTRLCEASQRVMEESAKLQSDRADDQVWIGRLSQQCVALQGQIASTAEQIRNFQNTVDWYENHVRRLTEVLQYHGIKF